MLRIQYKLSLAPAWYVVWCGRYSLVGEGPYLSFTVVVPTAPGMDRLRSTIFAGRIFVGCLGCEGSLFAARLCCANQRAVVKRCVRCSLFLLQSPLDLIAY